MQLAVCTLALAFVLWVGTVPATVNEPQPEPTDLGAIIDEGSPF